MGCGAAERPEVADLLKVWDTQEKARYKVGGATCSNPYNVTGRRTRTCGWDPTICRAADPACSLVPSQLFRQHQRWLLPPSLSNAQRERRLSAMWKAHPFATPQCSRAPTSSKSPYLSSLRPPTTLPPLLPHPTGYLPAIPLVPTPSLPHPLHALPATPSAAGAL